MFTLLYRMFYAVKQTRYKKEQMFGKFNLQVRAKPYGHPMQAVRSSNRRDESVKKCARFRGRILYLIQIIHLMILRQP